jgi:hypothetical protein
MRLIDADKLKQHYAWWGEDDAQKRLFDEIVDRQPTVAPPKKKPEKKLIEAIETAKTIVPAEGGGKG